MTGAVEECLDPVDGRRDDRVPIGPPVLDERRVDLVDGAGSGDVGRRRFAVGPAGFGLLTGQPSMTWSTTPARNESTSFSVVCAPTWLSVTANASWS